MEPMGPVVDDPVAAEGAPPSFIVQRPTRKKAEGRPPAPAVLRLDDGRQVVLGERLTIGSGPGNDLVLDDEFVSGRHCVIGREGRRVMVTDLGSRNGTLVGGTRVERAELHSGMRLVVGNTGLRLLAGDGPQGDELVGRGPAMQRLRREIASVAPAEMAVLLLGESGTGKELVARRVHAESGRAGEFIAVNCGGLAASVVESELFGHERGAFTGATARRAGVFEEADGGTLFLDEIGELPLELQPRLLRVLETGAVRAVGGQGERRVDVRIVAATNRDLVRDAEAGRFRLDLYHRLAQLPVHLPPLRARREDIPMLAWHFLQSMAGAYGAKGLSDAALAALVEHPWPGNVRELKNVVQRAAVYGGAMIEPGDLFAKPPAGGAAHQRTFSPHESILVDGRRFDEVERDVIERALRKHGGKQRAAAAELGIPRSTFSDKVRRYGLKLDGES